MIFSVQDASGIGEQLTVEAPYLMALAFYLMELEQVLELKVDRSAKPAPEVDAAKAAWSGGVGEFADLRVRLIPN